GGPVHSAIVVRERRICGLQESKTPAGSHRAAAIGKQRRNMSSPPLQTSGSLRRAAARELERIARARARTQARQEPLGEELGRWERGLRELDERAQLLDQLAGTSAGAHSDEPGEAAAAADPGEATVLRGAAIRATAVRLLLELRGPREPV